MKINFATDIVVQQDAVVSKTLLKNDGGTVTLFAFDTQQALSEHTAPFDALFNCVEGTFEVFIDKKPHQISKNELIVLPANVPHAVTALQPSKCLLVMIKVKKA